MLDASLRSKQPFTISPLSLRMRINNEKSSFKDNWKLAEQELAEGDL